MALEDVVAGADLVFPARRLDRCLGDRAGTRVRGSRRQGRPRALHPAHPSSAWWKVKVRHDARFVVVGFAMADSWPYALLVAERNGERLVYRGRVEWGGRRVIEAVAAGAQRRIRPTCVDVERWRDVLWIEPRVDVEVSYSEVMGGRLRDPGTPHRRCLNDNSPSESWRAVIDAIRGDGAKLALGGRSMGGRVASMVHADGVPCDALALFAYPLHPPGRPDKMRDEHLPSVRARTLFVSGTNDAFGSPDELRAAAAKVKRATVHMLEAADHGFNVKKASGRTKADVYEEAAGAMIRWLRV